MDDSLASEHAVSMGSPIFEGLLTRVECGDSPAYARAVPAAIGWAVVAWWIGTRRAAPHRWRDR